MAQFDFKTLIGVKTWLSMWEHDLLNTYRETFGEDDLAIARARVGFVRNFAADLIIFDPKNPQVLQEKLKSWLLHYEALAHTNGQHYGEDTVVARIPQGIAATIKIMYRQALDNE